jgi:hypothetical protein
MNWYKMAQVNDWNKAYLQVVKELGHTPVGQKEIDWVNKRVEDLMFGENLNDSNKDIWNKDPWAEVPFTTAEKWEDKIPGGNDKGSPNDFNKKDVEVGRRVEMEHTKDPDIAKEIAIDHLKEHEDYYVGLEHMESKLEDLEKDK